MTRQIRHSLLTVAPRLNSSKSYHSIQYNNVVYNYNSNDNRDPSSAISGLTSERRVWTKSQRIRWRASSIDGGTMYSRYTRRCRVRRRFKKDLWADQHIEWWMSSWDQATWWRISIKDYYIVHSLFSYSDLRMEGYYSRNEPTRKSLSQVCGRILVVHIHWVSRRN